MRLSLSFFLSRFRAAGTKSFTKMELERIKTTPFNRLQRKELTARKLFGRFHEDEKDDRVNAVRHPRLSWTVLFNHIICGLTCYTYT